MKIARVSAIAAVLVSVASLVSAQTLSTLNPDQARQRAAKTWQERYTDLDGRKVHYLEAGSGVPLVLVHGGLLWECAEANYWAVIPALAARYHVYAVDLPGWGFTPALGPQEYFPTAHGQFVIRFMKALGLKAHLIGNSRAGWIVQYVAHEAPDLVRSLVIINSGSGWQILPSDAPAPRSRDNVEPPTIESVRQTLQRFYFNKQFVTDAWVKRVHEISARNHAFDAGRTKAGGTTGADRNRMLEYHGKHMALSAGELNVPVLMTLSREDNPASHPDALTFYKRLKSGELHMFAHSGHHVQIEQSDRWAAVVLDFLSAHFPQSGTPSSQHGY
ncbi:MAG TPA: alpha/beta hydrolase [Vicinamibacterales bacterium]|nr:alpha/beta hydrolase [Vicinamibacterales bacterium]